MLHVIISHPNCYDGPCYLLSGQPTRGVTQVAAAHPVSIFTAVLQAPVDSPERFFVDIQFSNGANYDPTSVVPLHDNHVLPTQPRRPLTDAPGVPLQTLQELLGKYARGKNTPSNYQLQVGTACKRKGRGGSTAGHL